jgi:hypothetical protein
MRQNITYTESQIEEMETFYKECLLYCVDFNNYKAICRQAKAYNQEEEEKGREPECSVALLSFYALTRSRKDNLNSIVKRDFASSRSVRLPLVEFLKEQHIALLNT